MASEVAQDECQEFECEATTGSVRCQPQQGLVTLLCHLALAAMACVCRSVMARSDQHRVPGV